MNLTYQYQFYSHIRFGGNIGTQTIDSRLTSYLAKECYEEIGCPNLNIWGTYYLHGKTYSANQWWKVFLKGVKPQNLTTFHFDWGEDKGINIHRTLNRWKLQFKPAQAHVEPQRPVKSFSNLQLPSYPSFLSAISKRNLNEMIDGNHI